jgi:hypothetical protein
MAPKTWSLSKKQANYRVAPTQQVQCSECKWMFPRLSLGSCKYVRGVISASATCDEFESRHPHTPEPDADA